MTEADTCRTYVVPKLHNAGWSDEQIREQVTFTDGRIIPVGASHTRKPGKRADYILRYRTDFPIAVVEAKAEYKNPGDGLQQVWVIKARAFPGPISFFPIRGNGNDPIACV